MDTFPALPARTSRVLLCLLTLCLAVAPSLQSREPEIAPTTVTWSLEAADHAGGRLTLGGPGGLTLTRELEAGETPVLSLFTEDGRPLRDGAYTWELRLAPNVDPETRAALATLRAKGLDPGQTGIRTPQGTRRVGYLTVRDAAFVVPGSEGAPAAAGEAEIAAAGGREIAERATLLVDDACVGPGCTGGGIAFGDSTLLIHDTEPRIKLADTTGPPSPAFTSSDWEIEINGDPGASGNPNYFGINDCGFSADAGGCTGTLVFAIEDQLEASSLYLRDDNGRARMGLGTAIPQADIHVIRQGNPTLRLEQDDPNGFGNGIWDLGGNETNFFVRDAENGSTVPFTVLAGATTNTLTVGTGTRVGIGDPTPDDYLDIDLTGASGGLTITSPSSSVYPRIDLRGASEAWRVNVGSTGQWHFKSLTTGSSAIIIDPLVSNALLRLNSGQAQVTGGISVTGDVTSSGLSVQGSGEFAKHVTVGGDLTVAGVKSFVQQHPDDPARSFYYAALEGPEAATYFRGTAKTVDGRAVIDLPEAFSALTESRGLTVQLTPVGGNHDLWVEERSPERLVVREAADRDGAEFDYFIQGVRLGYAHYQVERPTPAGPGAQ